MSGQWESLLRTDVEIYAEKRKIVIARMQEKKKLKEERDFFEKTGFKNPKELEEAREAERLLRQKRAFERERIRRLESKAARVANRKALVALRLQKKKEQQEKSMMFMTMHQLRKLLVKKGLNLFDLLEEECDNCLNWPLVKVPVFRTGNKNKKIKRENDLQKHPKSCASNCPKCRRTARISKKHMEMKEAWLKEQGKGKWSARSYIQERAEILKTIVNGLRDIRIGKEPTTTREKLFFHLHLEDYIKKMPQYKELKNILKEMDHETTKHLEVPQFDYSLKHEMDDLAVDGDNANQFSAANTQINAAPSIIVDPVTSKELSPGVPFEMHDYASKWNHLADFVWKSDQAFDTNVHTIDVFNEVLQNLARTPAVIPFMATQFYSFDVELMYTINTNQFTSGQLQVGIVYGAGRVATADDSLVSVYTMSQKDHALINAGGEQEVILKIPYKFPFPLVKLATNSKIFDSRIATVITRVLSPLRSSSTNTFKTNVVVSCKLVNIKMSGMIAQSMRPNTEAEIEHEMLPAALNLAAKWLADSNRDKPPQHPSRVQVKPIASSNMSHGTGCSAPTEILRLDPDSAVPHGYGVNDFNISTVIRTYGLLSKFEVNTTHAIKTQLAVFEVSPLTTKEKYPKVTIPNDNSKFRLAAIPPIGVITSMYGYYRGSIEYRFDVVSTCFHACKLLVVFVPGLVKKDLDLVSMADYRSCHHQVFDVLKEKQFKFVVPYQSDQPYYPRRRMANVQVDEFEPYGHVYVVVLSNLYSSEVIAKNIDILVYQRAGEDFELAIPAQSMLLPSYDRTDAHRAIFQNIQFLDGYFPAYQGVWHSWTNSYGKSPILRYSAVSDHIAQCTSAHRYSVYTPEYNDKDYLPGWNMWTFNKDKVLKQIPIAAVCPIFDGTYYYMVPFGQVSSAKNFAYRCSISRTWGKLDKTLEQYTMDPENPVYEDDQACDAYPTSIGNLNFDMVVSYAEPQSFSHEVGSQNKDATIPVSINTSVDNYSSQHFGEQTMNLKDICRRDHLYCSVNIDKNLPFLTTSCIIPITPWGITLDNMSEDINPTRGNIGLVSSGYIFMKGSMRFKIVAEDSCKFWVQHRFDNYNIDEQVTIRRDQDAVNIGVASGYGIAIQDTNVNSVMDLEVPYYSPCSRIYCNPTSLNVDKSQYSKQLFNLGSLMIGCNKPCKFSIFYSLGDDCQFSDFNGFPPMLFLTDAENMAPVKVSLEIPFDDEKLHFDRMSIHSESSASSYEVLQHEMKSFKEDFMKTFTKAKEQAVTVVNNTIEISEQLKKEADSRAAFKENFIKAATVPIVEKKKLSVMDKVEETRQTMMDTGENVSRVADTLNNDLFPKVGAVCDSINGLIQQLSLSTAMKKFYEGMGPLIIGIVSNILHCMIAPTVGHVVITIGAILALLGFFSKGTLRTITDSLSSVVKFFMSTGFSVPRSPGEVKHHLSRSKTKLFAKIRKMMPLTEAQANGIAVFLYRCEDKDLHDIDTPLKLHQIMAKNMDVLYGTFCQEAHPEYSDFLAYVSIMILDKASPRQVKMFMDAKVTRNFLRGFEKAPNLTESHWQTLHIISQHSETLRGYLASYATYHIDACKKEECAICLNNDGTIECFMNYAKRVGWTKDLTHEADDSPNPLILDLIGVLFSSVATCALIKDDFSSKTKIGLAMEFIKKMPNIARGHFSVVNFLKTLWSTLERIFTIVKHKIIPEQRLTEELANKYVDVAEWVEEVIFLCHPDQWDKIKAQKIYQDRVDSAVTIGTNLICLLETTRKMTNNARFMVVIQTHYRNILQLKKTCHENKIKLGDTYEPFFMYFWGEPGLGKSYIKETIISTLVKELHIKHDGELIYTVPVNAQYWTNCTNQPFCYIDDFMVTTDQTVGLTMYQNIVAMKSSSSFVPNKAAVEDKGTPYAPLFLYVNSNVEKPQMEEISNVGAFLRRPELLVQVAMHPNLVAKGIVRANQVEPAILKKKDFSYLLFGVANREGELTASTKLNYVWYDFQNFMKLLVGMSIAYRVTEQANVEDRLKVNLHSSTNEELQARATKFLRPSMQDLDNKLIPYLMEKEIMKEKEETDLLTSVLDTTASLTEIVAGTDLVEKPPAFKDYPKHLNPFHEEEILTHTIYNSGNQPVASSSKASAPKKNKSYIPLITSPDKDAQLRNLRPETVFNIGGLYNHEAMLPVEDMTTVSVMGSEDIEILTHEVFVERMNKVANDTRISMRPEIFRVDPDFVYLNMNRSLTNFLDVSKIRNIETVHRNDKVWRYLLEWNSQWLDNLEPQSDQVPVFLRTPMKCVLQNKSALRILFDEYILDTKNWIKKWVEKSTNGFFKVYDWIVKYKWLFAILALVLGGAAAYNGFTNKAVNTTLFAVGGCRDFKSRAQENKPTMENITPDYEYFLESNEERILGSSKRRLKALRKAGNIMRMQHQSGEYLGEDLAFRICQSTYWLKVYCKESGMVIRSDRAFIIAGRTALVPRHYLEYYDNLFKKNPENYEVFIEKFKLKIPLSFDDLRNNKEYGKTSLLQITLPNSFPAVKDSNGMVFRGDVKNLTTNGAYLVVPTWESLRIYSTTYEVTDVAIPSNNVGSEVYIRQGYRYDIHGPGYCGSLLVVGNKILGMHVAGGGGHGISESVSESILMHEAAIPEDVPSKYLAPEEDCKMMQHVKLNNPGSYIDMGVCKRAYTGVPSGATKFGKTFFATIPKLNEEVGVPAHLEPFADSNNVFISPLFEGISHHMLPIKPFPSDVLTRAANDYSTRILAHCKPVRTKVGKMSYDGAIYGLPENSHYPGIDRTTSVGFPYTREGNQWNNKNALFGLGKGDTKPEFIRHCVENDCKRAKNIVPFTVFQDCLKDDIIAREKLMKPGSTRIISCSPIEYTVNCRRYFGDFINAMSNSVFECEIAVGMNVKSRKWHELVMHMNGWSDSMIDGDYSKFGPRLCSRALFECVTIINKWYALYGSTNPMEDRIRVVMMTELVNSVHLAGRYFYKTVAGAPSGSPMTVVLNSMVNSLYIRCVWQQLGNKIQHFGDLVRMITYGDDLWIAVKKVRDGTYPLTFDKIRDVLAEHSIKFTNATKSTESRSLLPLTEVSFLKSGMNYMGEIEHFVYTLDITSINKMLVYVRGYKPSVYNQILVQNCAIALVELIPHGPVVYDRYSYWIANLLAKHMSIEVSICDYDEALMMLHQHIIGEGRYPEVMTARRSSGRPILLELVDRTVEEYETTSLDLSGPQNKTCINPERQRRVREYNIILPQRINPTTSGNSDLFFK